MVCSGKVQKGFSLQAVQFLAFKGGCFHCSYRCLCSTLREREAHPREQGKAVSAAELKALSRWELCLH